MNLTTDNLHIVENEPRILDLVLAERLGFERPRVIRELLYRNKPELETYGGLPYRTANLGAKGGRPSTECWLNEGQALLVCMFSQTPRAAEVRKQVVDVFMAWRQGKTVPVREHHRRPPAPCVAANTFSLRGDGRRAVLELHVPAQFAMEIVSLSFERGVF